MINGILRNLRSAGRSNAGAVAVEFAIIAPILAVALLTLSDTATFVTSQSSMQRAARAGTQYFMGGGTDTTAATSVVNTSWYHKPTDGSVSISSSCLCGSTVATCTTACAAGVTLVKNRTVTLSATIAGILISRSGTVVETVRSQ